MKLKSSNTKTFVFLGGLVLISLLLISLKLIGYKPSKYVKAPEIEQKTELDFLQLAITEKSYKKLKKKRDKAISVGILQTTDTDYVPATITYNGVEYRAEVRLKGDGIDHLRGDKWSFRVKLKEDKTIMGMRKFSIHNPGTRGFINEWLYHKAVKKEGLIGLRYGFLEGMIHVKKANGSGYVNKDVGIYAIEETFDKRTIESNKRKESVILKFSEAGYWTAAIKHKKTGNPSGIFWTKFMDYRVDFPILPYGESKVLADSTMNNYFKTSKNLLEDVRSRKKTIDYAFDIKKLAKHNAILNLFGATHGLYTMNLRFYYNPITSKLEPIAFDGNSGLKLKRYEHVFFTDLEKDSIYLKELAYALDKVSKPQYLDGLMSENNKEILRFDSILKKEFKFKLYHEDVYKDNQQILKKELVRLTQKYQLRDIDTSIKLVEDLKEGFTPNIASFNTTQIALTKTSQKRDNNHVYKLDRKSTAKAAYTVIRDIDVAYGNYHQVSIKVKKTGAGNYFGLRIQGNYPERVDAIFDLDKGKVKGVKKVGSFEGEEARIVSLKDGWYEVIIKAKINLDGIKLVFGPTNKAMC